MNNQLKRTLIIVLTLFALIFGADGYHIEGDALLNYIPL